MSISLIPRPLTGRHVAIAFIGFFGALIVADAVWIITSIKTYDGQVSPTAYRDGLAYNDRIDAAREQAALGWQWVTETHILEERGEGRVVRIRTLATDEDGRPVSGLTLEAILVRPVVDGLDQRGRMVEVQAGAYETILSAPAAGNWQLAIKAVERALAYVDERLLLK